ncbi:MAG TPA: hypothetical protein VMB77_08550 [Syntrophales bacterium]|nr:hypothetical protein [Syntrophales bacterium]
MIAETGYPLRKWLCVAIFAVAFAYVESAVVVYLREIYFEGFFEFPIADQDRKT